MGTIHRGASITIALAVFAACSSSSSGGGGVSADQAAGDAAKAICQKFNGCSAFFIQLAYGDADACTASLTTSLKNTLAASGTGATPAQLEACAAAVPGTSCDDVVGHDLPSDCQAAKGTLAAGAPCGDSSQCTSAYCHLAAGTTCGACAAAPKSGDACNADADCPAGNTCNKAGTCAAPGAAGATCDGTQHPCKPTLSCKGGTCATPDAAGAACTKTTDATGSTLTDSCDALAGLYCNAKGTCVAIGLESAGQPCLLVNGALAVCSGNGTCNAATKLSTMGTCLAAAAPGASCTPKDGAQIAYGVSTGDCAAPAVCENGVCTTPDTASCH
jgi:hypothetical protein